MPKPIASKVNNHYWFNDSGSTPGANDRVSQSLQSSRPWGKGRIPGQTSNSEGRMKGVEGCTLEKQSAASPEMDILKHRRKNIRMLTLVLSGFYFPPFAYFYLNFFLKLIIRNTRC